MRSFFKSRKANIFIVFLTLSLIYSLLTKLSKDYTQTVRFQIQPKQIPEDKLVLKDSLHYMDITLTTFGFQFARYYFSSPYLNINIDQLQKKENAFIWARQEGFSMVSSQFDTDVKIESINPDTLVFRFDQSAVKKVPVFIDNDIEFALGFDSSEQIKATPDSIKVIGPKTIIDTIQSLYTELVTLKDVSKNIATSVQLKLPDVLGQVRYSNKTVDLNLNVEKFTEGSITVPVNLINVPEDLNINYYPKTVEVTYYTSLSNFEVVTTNDVEVVCDFSKVNNNTAYLTPEIVASAYMLKNVRLNTNKIQYILVQ